MAGFLGMAWAPGQLVYDLTTGLVRREGLDAGVPAVSRSVHYGLFLAFEGIRFFVREVEGELRFTFVNLAFNTARFRRSMAFNLEDARAHLIPTDEALSALFLQTLSLPENRPHMLEMARTRRQGYLRPFTADEDRSIGVTFPKTPTIRVVAAGYDGYMGEPFHGVVVPELVRAMGVNGTGCLKLGTNYLMSVKAVQAAQARLPGASAALFLDDRPHEPVEQRLLTEWDSSAAMIALADGRVLRIPDSPLILPSVTVRGLSALLRRRGVPVEEREVPYGELYELARSGQIVTLISVGTAGVLNRAERLLLHDGHMMRADLMHPLWATLGEVKDEYKAVFSHDVEPPEGMTRVEHGVQIFPA